MAIPPQQYISPTSVVPVQRPAYPEAAALAASRINQMPPKTFDMAMTQNLAAPAPLSQEAMNKVQVATNLGPPAPTPANPVQSFAGKNGILGILERKAAYLSGQNQPAQRAMQLPPPLPPQASPTATSRLDRVRQILASRRNIRGISGLLGTLLAERRG